MSSPWEARALALLRRLAFDTLGLWLLAALLGLLAVRGWRALNPRRALVAGRRPIKWRATAAA